MNFKKKWSEGFSESARNPIPRVNGGADGRRGSEARVRILLPVVAAVARAVRGLAFQLAFGIFYPLIQP